MLTIIRLLLTGFLAVAVAGCGGKGPIGGSSGSATSEAPTRENPTGGKRQTIWDLFTNADDPNVTIAVNKYIWNASLDVLNFLPVEGADPFSGVIVTGWGRAKGSSRTYRATIYVQDAALDARSLRVALVTRSGPANRDTIRAIEDAILTRARQLRIADSKL